MTELLGPNVENEMSDVMLLGVLRMPMDDPDPLTLRQFVSRAQQAACRIEADADELAELRAKIDRLRAAGLGVVVHMEGRQPVRGWLKDNDKSRDALAELVRALGA